MAKSSEYPNYPIDPEQAAIDCTSFSDHVPPRERVLEKMFGPRGVRWDYWQDTGQISFSKSDGPAGDITVSYDRPCGCKGCSAVKHITDILSQRSEFPAGQVYDRLRGEGQESVEGICFRATPEEQIKSLTEMALNTRDHPLWKRAAENAKNELNEWFGINV